MPLWIPALKAALPYVASVVGSAIPAFTARKDQARTNDLISQQIAELQQAVTANAGSIRLLAQQLENTLKAVEQGGNALERSLNESRELLVRHERLAAQREQEYAQMQRTLRQTRWLALGALATALLALLAALRPA